MPSLNMSMHEALELLRRQYFQLLPLERLSLPSDDILKDATFQASLVHKLFRADDPSPLDPERYKLRVLKGIVSRLESAMSDPEEDDISNDLMSCLTGLVTSHLPSEVVAAQKKYHVQYTIPLPLCLEEEVNTISLLESRAVISAAGGTGHRTWDAALRLGTYLASAEGSTFVEGKSVLELGAGTGFLSILCAKCLGARYVLATDGDTHAVEAIEDNLRINRLDEVPTIKSKAYRWGHHLEGLWEQEHEPLQTVLAADVVRTIYKEKPNEVVRLMLDQTYDEALIAPLLATLWSLLHRYPTLKIIIAATIRNKVTWEAFESVSRMASLQITDIPLEPPPMEHQTGFFHSTAVPIRIVQLTRIQAS